MNGHLPIWRAVGGGESSAVKAGYAGVPMNLAMLGGPVSTIKRTIDVYRESARMAGFDEKKLPITTGGLFYIAKDTETALREFYPNVNHGMFKANGQWFPRQAFAHAKDPKSVMNVGEVNEVIEKILYQHEEFGNQRYMAQLDFGGVPFDKIKENITILGEKVLPAIRKYTTPKENN